jgi:hypothetical protein
LQRVGGDASGLERRVRSGRSPRQCSRCAGQLRG